MDRKCKILKLTRNIIIFITLLVQALLIGAVTIVNSLTDKKAGVMHHVYYRRSQYEQGIYSAENLNYQFAFFLIIGMLFCALLAYSLKMKKGRVHSFEMAMTSLMTLAAAGVIKSSFFEGLLAYPYFIIAFEISAAIQLVSLAKVLFFDRKARLSCK